MFPHLFFVLMAKRRGHREAKRNIMEKHALTGRLVGLALLGSAALISCTIPKTSGPVKTNSDTVTVANIESNADSLHSDTTIVAHIGNDVNFSFLINEGSQPYMTISINMKSEIMAYWGDVEKRIVRFGVSINDLKQILLERFETDGRLKEDEAIHVEIDVSTPKKAISELKDMMLELGINHCELVDIHNGLELRNLLPPQAVTQAEVLNIVEGDVEIEEVTLISAKDQAEFVEVTDDVPIEVEVDKSYNMVEESPEFPGGMAELMKYLQKNVKYPQEAKDKNIHGRVIVQFVVNKDGSICDANVVKRVDPQLDAEALRVVNAMPRWIPGKQKGKCVRTRFTLPVTFRLPDEGGSSL